MNWSFLMGAFTGWLAFTPEGRKLGDTMTAKCMRFVRENYLMEKKDDNKRTV